MRDIEASVSPAVNALALPKVAGPDHVRLLDELVSELEAERGMAVGATAFLAMIETPEAFFQIGEIAKASGAHRGHHDRRGGPGVVAGDAAGRRDAPLPEDRSPCTRRRRRG